MNDLTVLNILVQNSLERFSSLSACKIFAAVNNLIVGSEPEPETYSSVLKSVKFLVYSIFL